MSTDAKRPVEPDDIYLLRYVSDPQVSPDGRRVAYVVAWNDRDSDSTQSAIYVAPVHGRQPARRFSYGIGDHSPRWSPDGRYLAFVSGRGENDQLFLAPLDGGEARQVTRAKSGIAQPVWSPDGNRVAYVAWVGECKEPKDLSPVEKSAPRVIRELRYKLDGVGFVDERRLHIFTVNVENGVEAQVTDGDWNDEQPTWSPDGKRIAFVSDRGTDRFQRELRTDVWVVPSTGGRARKLTRSKGAAAFPAFSPDGRSIAFLGHEHGDAGWSKNVHLLVISAERGRAPRSLSAPLDRSVAGYPTGYPLAAGHTFAWLPDGKGLLFLAGDRGAQALYQAGLDSRPVREVLAGDRHIESVTLVPGSNKIIFIASWPSEPREIYCVVPGGAVHEQNLSHANDEIGKAVEFGRVCRMRCRATDGLEIESFVVFPPGYERGKRYPTVLDIHGGPHWFSPPGFSVPLQSLVAAGYVDLLVNPRGSMSYGEKFAEACVGDWGGKDFEDLMIAVDEMERQGIADPERLYVGGYSYGGFMTGWIVGHSDRFRAAVMGAAVANQLSMLGATDIPGLVLHELGSMPFEEPEVYWQRSPVSYLANVKTPVLLVHWEGDLRCPVAQSEEVFQGLRLLGKEVEFVRYPGGSHAVFAPSQQVDAMKRIHAWYDSHPPSKAAKPRVASRRRASRLGELVGGRSP